MLVVTDLGFMCGVKCKYYPDYIARLKKVPGAKWNNISNQWEIPKNSLFTFETLFYGEIYWKTPRWKIHGLKNPGYKIEMKKHFDLPKMKINLYKYQEFSYQFLMNKLDEYGFGFNALDVGLGKTPIAIACLYKMLLDNKVSKCIILAKKSIKKQWVDEFRKFTDIDTVVDYLEFIPENATKSKRKKMYETLKQSNKGIIVTTYQSCLHDKDDLKKLKADMLIIDEAHILRTVNGEMNNAVCSISEKIKYKLLLTGTPIMNKPKDAYALMNICDKKYFDMSFKEFKERYVVSQWKSTYEEEIGYKNIDELRFKCQDVMIRLTEHEVDIELPEITISRINVSMDKTQRELLEHLKGEQKNILDELSSVLSAIQQGKKQGKDTSQLEARYYRLEATSKGFIACRQAIANDPKLLAMSNSALIRKTFDGMVPNSYKSSEKTEMCIDIVENVLNANGKVIIFSNFERSTRLLQEIINKELKVNKKLKVNVLTYSGDVNEQDRLKAVDLFKNNDDYNVLIGTNSMAEGINLQEANYLINYDQPDTTAIKIQRIGRIRRASSTYKHGFVYDLITEGTVDQENIDKLENQDNIFGSVVGLSQDQTEGLKELVN